MTASEDRRRKPRPKILVADDEVTLRKILEVQLKKAGLEPIIVTDGQEAVEKVQELGDEINAALLDVNMPRLTGLEALEKLKELLPDVPVVMMSAKTEVKDAVEAMKKGALEYLTKPFDLDEVIALARQTTRMGQVSRRRDQLEQAVGSSKPISGFVGQSPAAQRLLQQVKAVAPLDSTILITGESGVGKGLLARTIHYSGPRANGPFVSVSCPSLPRELLESEMFGHEKGSFTGAHQQRIGRIEMAHGGTLFLDEVGDLPLDLQPKLLTFLQEREFFRVGGTEPHQADVRVIAATNADLRDKVRSRDFREDLFFRLNVLPLEIPPLRDRAPDVPILAGHILSRIAESRKVEGFQLDDDAVNWLTSYTWPGNVRELENVLERASAFCVDGVITRKDLVVDSYFLDEDSAEKLRENTPDTGPDHSAAGRAGSGSHNGSTPRLVGMTMEEIEKMAICQTLEEHAGNKAQAARSLGITEKTIYNKLKRYDHE
jgi:DNA-binding NtrC family response regulator